MCLFVHRIKDIRVNSTTTSAPSDGQLQHSTTSVESKHKYDHPTSSPPSMNHPTTSALLKQIQEENRRHQRYCTHPQQQNIVCIKVHKAASTTTAAILERFGWRNNLTLAVPPDRKNGPHILSSTQKFNRRMMANPYGKYNMLTNHVRYSREEMANVIPNATYMTIIRHPVKHFESAFGYFFVNRVVAPNMTAGEDPIEVFMRTPDYFLNKRFGFWFQMKNGQIFDLGIDHGDHTGPKITETIQRYDEEFDLIMIAEYFDESLLLLRQHLCLSWNDILYIKDNFRADGKRIPLSDDVQKKIEIWNWADMALYKHFNTTFWQKISDYGDEFDRDLQYFRDLLRKTKIDCTEDEIQKKPGDLHGVMGYVLRQNASEFCKDLMLGDVEYTHMFRDRQTKVGL